MNTDKSKLEAQKENFSEKQVNKISCNPVLSAVHSCRNCRRLYWNEFEKIYDCQLGYLGKWSYADIDGTNECEDYEHCG